MTTVLHRCTAVGWMPSGITSLAASDGDSRLLAVGRESGAVEVWSMHHGWHCTHRLLGGAPSAAEAVCWTPCGTAVLSAGLSGNITLWSLTLGRPRQVVDSYGGAVWAMALEPTTATLAIACEDGCIRLFSYTSVGGEDGGQLEYLRALSGFSGRALSLCWGRRGRRLYAGGADGTIRRWSEVPAALERGSSLPACDLIISSSTGGDAAESGGSTLIWTLALARGEAQGAGRRAGEGGPDGDDDDGDETIVSGDSRGFTKFWEGTHGTLVQEFRAHVADVLALAVGDDGSSVFSCGADPSIVHFRCAERRYQRKSASSGTDMGGAQQAPSAAADVALCWVLASKQSAAHTHDVRAMTVVEDAPGGGGSGLLLSGGVDTVVCHTSLSRFDTHARPVRHWASPPPSVASLALAAAPSGPSVAAYRQAPLVLFCQDRHLELWQMGRQAEQEGQEKPKKKGGAARQPGYADAADGHSLAVASGPRLLVEIRPRDAGAVTGAAISPDAAWVACAMPGELKMFRVEASVSVATAAEAANPPPPVRVRRVAASLLRGGGGAGGGSSLGAEASGAMAFTPSSSHLILGGISGRLDVLDLHSFTVVRSFNAPPGGGEESGGAGAAAAVRKLAVSADGAWLASMDAAQRVRLYNLDSMQVCLSAVMSARALPVTCAPVAHAPVVARH
jgi:WD40 repeat protein